MKDPDIHDWGKLRRVLQLSSKTTGNVRVIGDGNIYDVLTYVDALYDTHNYMRGRTGGCMTFGWVLINEKMSNKKLHTKISTGSEVIGDSNYTPFSIWLAMYMEHQGYKVKQKKLMQDNMSAIKMEKNAQNSRTGNFRHINIRYLFVKDRVDKK